MFFTSFLLQSKVFMFENKHLFPLRILQHRLCFKIIFFSFKRYAGTACTLLLWIIKLVHLVKFRLGLKNAICNSEDKSPFKWLINIDTRDTDKYIWNTPSMWCLAGGQTGRTLVVSLEPTFKWLVLCIYNLFNPPAAQALDSNANWATDRGGRGPGTLSKRPRKEITTWALKHEHKNVQVPNNGIDTPAATQICNRSRKRCPLKRAWQTGHCKSFSREFRLPMEELKLQHSSEQSADVSEAINGSFQMLTPHQRGLMAATWLDGLLFHVLSPKLSHE